MENWNWEKGYLQFFEQLGGDGIKRIWNFYGIQRDSLHTKIFLSPRSSSVFIVSLMAIVSAEKTEQTRRLYRIISTLV